MSYCCSRGGGGRSCKGARKNAGGDGQASKPASQRKTRSFVSGRLLYCAGIWELSGLVGIPCVPHMLS